MVLPTSGNPFRLARPPLCACGVVPHTGAQHSIRSGDTLALMVCTALDLLTPGTFLSRHRYCGKGAWSALHGRREDSCGYAMSPRQDAHGTTIRANGYYPCSCTARKLTASTNHNTNHITGTKRDFDLSDTSCATATYLPTTAHKLTCRLFVH